MNNAELVELLLNRMEDLILRNATLQDGLVSVGDKLYEAEQALEARTDVQELNNLGSDIRVARESLNRVMQSPDNCKITLIKLYRALNRTGLRESKEAIETSPLWRALRVADDNDYDADGAVYDLPGI